MKIREVKIQAFKSYLKEKDSTFDFSWHKDTSKVANIISIFAPNGFGKTSFYDAVDYCYTNNITRYIRDDKTRVQNKKNATRQSFIVRNRNADNEVEKLDTQVKIETEDNVEFISPIIKHSHKGSDYKFNDDNTPNDRKYFRDLMLSQEAIDAFLRETNPVDRFKKFATKQVNNLSILNDKRISISQLLTDIESKLREVKNQEHEKTCEIVLIDTDKDILEKINKAINECNLLGVDIPLISKPYNISTHQSLIMTITGRIEALNFEKNDLEGKNKLLVDFVSNFENLEDSVSNLKILNKDKSQLISLLSDLELLLKCNVYLKKFTEEKEALELKFNQVGSFCFRNEEFYESHNKKNVLLKNREKEKEKSEILNDKIAIIGSDIKESRKASNLISKQLDEYEKLQSRIDMLFNSIELRYKEKEEGSFKLKDIEQKIIVTKRKISESNEAKKTLSRFSIDSLFESNSLVTNVEELNELYYSFKENNGRISSVDFKINEDNRELEQLKHQEASVSQLISIGYDLINKNKSKDCPLCSQSFKDFDKLKGAIESNRVIDSISGKLLKNLSNLNEEKSELIRQNKRLIIEHKSIITQQIEKHIRAIQLSETELSIYYKDEKNIKIRMSNIDSELDALKDETLFMSKESFQEHVSLKAGESKKNLSVNKLKIDVLDKRLEELNESKRLLSNGLRKVFEDIDSIEKSEFYKGFIKLCDELLIDINDGEKNTSNELVIFQENISTKIKKLSLSIDSEKKLKKELELKIPVDKSVFSKEEVNELIKLNELSEKKILDSFYLYQELFIKTPEYWFDLENARSEVDVSIAKIASELERASQKINNLKLLNKLAEEASSLSEGIKLQNELSVLEVERKGLDKLKAVMNSDVDLIDSEIKSYIDDYFYVDLINELYNAIDPHPEFKSIKFEYVSNKNPELHIKVKGNSDGDAVAPALHFSSAQINVLSLSIFLAKALNTKSSDGEPANCIFIDDPVQSMDAINVLSIIDLLRNIAVRFNKQLIISTHDENFHELLKKKIPSNLFKSKFLKLESFGKVAVDE